MKCPLPHTMDDVLEAIQKDGPNKRRIIDESIRAFCKCESFRRMVFSYVLQNGGQSVDAEDVWQEGLAQLAISLWENKYKGQSNLENYAFGICKFKWQNMRNKKKLNTVEINHGTKEVSPELTADSVMIEEENQQFLWNIISNMKGICPKYLKLWAYGYSPKEIAVEMNVNDRRARKNTYECRKKLRDQIMIDERAKTFLKYIKNND